MDKDPYHVTPGQLRKMEQRNKKNMQDLIAIVYNEPDDDEEGGEGKSEVSMLNPFSWGNGLAPAPPPPPNADEEKMHALGHWANYDTKEQDPDKKNLDPEHIPQDEYHAHELMSKYLNRYVLQWKARKQMRAKADEEKTKARLQIQTWYRCRYMTRYHYNERLPDSIVQKAQDQKYRQFRNRLIGRDSGDRFQVGMVIEALPNPEKKTYTRCFIDTDHGDGSFDVNWEQEKGKWEKDTVTIRYGVSNTKPRLETMRECSDTKRQVPSGFTVTLVTDSAPMALKGNTLKVSSDYKKLICGPISVPMKDLLFCVRGWKATAFTGKPEVFRPAENTCMTLVYAAGEEGFRKNMGLPPKGKTQKEGALRVKYINEREAEKAQDELGGLSFALEPGKNPGYSRGDMCDLFTKLFFELSDEKAFYWDKFGNQCRVSSSVFDRFVLMEEEPDPALEEEKGEEKEEAPKPKKSIINVPKRLRMTGHKVLRGYVRSISGLPKPEEAEEKVELPPPPPDKPDVVVPDQTVYEAASADTGEIVEPTEEELAAHEAAMSAMSNEAVAARKAAEAEEKAARQAQAMLEAAQKAAAARVEVERKKKEAEEQKIAAEAAAREEAYQQQIAQEEAAKERLRAEKAALAAEKARIEAGRVERLRLDALAAEAEKQRIEATAKAAAAAAAAAEAREAIAAEEAQREADKRAEEEKHALEYERLTKAEVTNQVAYRDQLYALGVAFYDRDNIKFAIARWEKAAELGSEEAADRLEEARDRYAQQIAEAEAALKAKREREEKQRIEEEEAARFLREQEEEADRRARAAAEAAERAEEEARLQRENEMARAREAEFLARLEKERQEEARLEQERAHAAEVAAAKAKFEEEQRIA
eukprot:CAMPEP_0119488426 /NCGR_PEP_ID=MMETSP1344-20130328/14209_1 /TAXON_ID=236787 /ORGANISM="Florenciella parvula, Strain CCMP2471" /LENGTH=872 /DNA_ID=CAMNT_0007523381 /DNA_START=152 /DNA_END=2766 /DNA_ORIENTATION=-